MNSKTLESALTQAMKHRDRPIACAICDRSYRGNKQVGETEIHLLGKALKRDTPYSAVKGAQALSAPRCD